LNVSFPELREVVTSNDKQRFSMILASTLDKPSETDSPLASNVEPEVLETISESDDPSDYLIRANQGHSIKVDTEGLLTPVSIEAGNVPQTVVHGTDESAWKLIMKSGGLRKMGRNHMHFASGLPAGFKSQDADADGTTEEEKSAPPVISGMRKSSTVLIYIDIIAALEAGVKFFVSENGVILTEGDEKGVLPYRFFKRVESRKQGGGVLMKDGVLPEGVVVDVEEWERESGQGKKKGGGRGGRVGGRGGKARANDDSADLLTDV
jgi:2'-phosphotransferase